MHFSPQPGAYFQNHAHNEEAEGRPRVTLVSRNARFAHEGRPRVTLVSQSACFAHEGHLRVSLVSPSGYFAHEGLGT